MTVAEHVVTRINDHYYVCNECGQAGSEAWAILHPDRAAILDEMVAEAAVSDEYSRVNGLHQTR